MNNILTITQSGKVFIVQFQDQKLYCLNQKALCSHLKHHAKLTTTQIASITHIFEYQDTVEVDLAKIG